jgi:LysM repeat protein
MRVRTWSACVALAWAFLLIMTAAGPIGSLRPAQATTRIASTTSTTSTSTSTQATLTSSVTTTPTTTPTTNLTGTPAGRPEAAGASAAPARPAPQPTAGDSAHARTGSGIAAGADTRAGAGAYVVQPGDTLSGIAAALGTNGGWQAPYAANRPAIGPDPDVINAGTVLVIPHPGLPARPPLHQVPTASPAPHRTVQPTESAPVTAPSGRPTSARPLAGARPSPRPAQGTSMGGLPRWLEIVLVAAGLLIATAFLTEPVMALARRRRGARPAAADARIVLADYERLVVTHNRADGTVYVLRPPNVDPQAILLAARLVLAQDRYEALAGHLGVPAHWPRE